MNPFHTNTLYAKQPPVDRIAWLLATATIPMNIHRQDDTPQYRHENTRLWNLEAYQRAVKIREVLNDLVKHT